MKEKLTKQGGFGGMQSPQGYSVHPVYKKYAANEDGEIIHVKLLKPRIGNLKETGYLSFTIYVEKNRYKNFLSHRFVWECFYGPIEKGKQINHINCIRTDNRLKNLEVVTPSENCKKSAKNKDSKLFNKKAKKVLAINLVSKKETKFDSIYSITKILGINPGQVSMICKGLYRTATSKIDGQKYTFSFID